MVEEDDKLEKKVIDQVKAKGNEERKKKVEDSQYNEVYKVIRGEEKPKYLSGNRKYKDRRLIARYRCGNESKTKEYWKGKEDKICRVCGKEEEGIAHVIKECETTKTTEEIKEVLGSNGQGLEVLKRIERERERVQKNRN